MITSSCYIPVPGSQGRSCCPLQRALSCAIRELRRGTLWPGHRMLLQSSCGGQAAFLNLLVQFKGSSLLSGLCVIVHRRLRRRLLRKVNSRSVCCRWLSGQSQISLLSAAKPPILFSPPTGWFCDSLLPAPRIRKFALTHCVLLPLRLKLCMYPGLRKRPEVFC